MSILMPVTSTTRAVSMNQMLNCLSDDCCFLAAVQAPGYSCPRYQNFLAPHCRAPGDFIALGLRDNTAYVSIEFSEAQSSVAPNARPDNAREYITFITERAPTGEDREDPVEYR
jgi:hypothetical protein